MSDRDCDIGYGKPPKATRFQKGQSGNPKGRPKGTRNLKTDLREELSERIPVQEGDRRRRISKQRAIVKRLTEKALKGDNHALKNLTDLILRLFGVDEEGGDAAGLSPDDRETLDAALGRRLAQLRQTGTEPTDNTDSEPRSSETSGEPDAPPSSHQEDDEEGPRHGA